jgi:hypothetical protein
MPGEFYIAYFVDNPEGVPQWYSMVLSRYLDWYPRVPPAKAAVQSFPRISISQFLTVNANKIPLNANQQ